MATDYNDPFTMVYDALWSMLEASPYFTDAVRVKNRIKFVGDRNPLKDSIQAADTPEVRLIPVSVIPHLQRTSDSTSFYRTFEIQVATGEQSIDQPDMLFPVEWAVFKAMLHWELRLADLVWCNQKFVILARPTPVTEGVSEDDINRGIKGWSAVWGCEVQMWFNTAQLLGE